MKSTKRLFLFAGYDKQGIIDDAIIYYAQQLNKFGDVILYMDNDADKSEIDKIKKYCIHAVATRHGEYDFGSYKRCFIWARDNKILDNYEYVYIVNDSVFGPLSDPGEILNKLESIKSDAAGIVVSTHKTHSYMESWFIRLNKKIFTSDWFDTFMTGITGQPTKNSVSVKYEHGLSRTITANNCSWDGVYIVHNRYTYNNPKRLFQRGCPFIKKACLVRHGGATGNQIKFILKHSVPDASNAIIKTAKRVYGTEYINKLLTYNPFKIFLRKLKYAGYKIMGGAK